MRFITGLLACASTVALVSTASAQTADVVELSEFDLSALKGAWSAEQMQDSAVYGEDGEQVGEVQSIIIGPDDKAQRIIVETGGFLDIGDKAISIPYDQVEVTPDEEGVSAPVDEENLEDFSLFDGTDVETDQRSFRASEVIGDYVRLKDEQNYGYVTDLIFEQDGTLRSIVVSPDAGWATGGYYGYPWYGYDYGFDPASPYYDLPYGEEDIAGYEPFDYDGMFDDGVF